MAGVLVAVLAVFFQRTRIGRALRAVADDHQAAQSVGIPLRHIWVIVWSVAGLVALVAGVIWGSKLGVQFSIALVALKALPVLMLGGLTSVPGAIVGGLMIGAGEKLSEVYPRAASRRRHRELVRLRAGAARAAGAAAGPVWRANHRAGMKRDAATRSPPVCAGAAAVCYDASFRQMIYREAGQFRTSYAADQALFPIRQDRCSSGLCCCSRSSWCHSPPASTCCGQS